MKKISIKPGCLGCGLCASIAPDVFVVCNISRIKEDAPLDEQKEKIEKAAQACPVGVIEYTP